MIPPAMLRPLLGQAIGAALEAGPELVAEAAQLAAAQLATPAARRRAFDQLELFAGELRRALADGRETL